MTQPETDEILLRNEENVLDDQESVQMLLSEANGEGIAVYPQKRKLSLAIAICGLFVAVGIWMVQDHTAESIVLGILCLLFFGLGLLLLLYRLLVHAPLLVINEEGVSMTRFGGLFVKWEEIAFINASKYGYSYRQVHRWWQTYRSEGLHALLQRGSSPGRPTQLSPQAWQDLEAQMRAGHLASLKDAQAYLRDHWNIAYASLNGIWNQMQRHHAKPKTGRPHHRRQQPDQQTAFQKTSPRLSSTNR